MSGRALEDRLARLASAGLRDGAERELRVPDAANLLTAILREADMIVMPGELRLEGQDGPGLALEVANRRILRAVPFTHGAATLTVNQGAPETLEALRRMLDLTLGRGASARIAHAALGRDIDPAEPGITVSGLADTWGIDLAPGPRPTPAEALDGFFAAAGDALTAWTVLDGATAERFGDGARAEALADLAESPDLERLREEASEDAWRFVAAASGDAGSRAALFVGGTTVLMEIAPGRLGEIADRWRRAIG